ncbi:hypothetical protein FNV43_RR16020 [Rhamnella rubrinervis]|uniref:Dynein light chain n=1 Tax=Rhamnella rubrinervis TaxID=2594499 RepID=A0A8K0GX87_9ROSA|nr:hypothetical protein FNV43_RR16020 [Rhamnella rubrinervis]
MEEKKDKQDMQKEKQQRKQQQQHGDHSRSSTEGVMMKLAAMAIKLNLRLRSSDMPPLMQEHVLRFTRSFLDSSPKTTPLNPSLLANALKKEFDSLYGPAWHCVAGTSFGSFVTHSPGGFVYFSIDSLSVLLFKTQVQLVLET